MDQILLEEILKGTRVRNILYYPRISSTNDEALSRLKSGGVDLDWTLVIANEQTAGRGRMERKWITQPESSLAFTLIIQPELINNNEIYLFSPLGALAVCQALENEYGLKPSIKWPNDVLLDGRKTCGILAETCWLGDVLQGVVIGIGINVTSDSIPPQNALMFPATCIDDALGKPVDRLQLLQGVIQAMAEWQPEIGSNKFINSWESRLALKGEWVRIEMPGKEAIKGIVSGITSLGDLRLKQENGKEIFISVGDVRLRPI